jgi:hypothetical protein
MAFLGSSAVRFVCPSINAAAERQRERGVASHFHAGSQKPQLALFWQQLQAKLRLLKWKSGPEFIGTLILADPYHGLFAMHACVCVCSTPASITLLPWLGLAAEEEREREVNHNSCAPKRECGCAPQCLNHPARCCTHDFTL